MHPTQTLALATILEMKKTKKNELHDWLLVLAIEAKKCLRSSLENLQISDIYMMVMSRI